MAYHLVLEGAALDEWSTTYINTHENIADLMTKNLPSGIKRTKFCRILLYFFPLSIEAGEEDDHNAAAAAVKILPGQWIEVIIGQSVFGKNRLQLKLEITVHLFIFYIFIFV